MPIAYQLSLQLDLQNNGNFADPDDDITAYFLNGQWSAGRDSTQAKLPSLGKATFTLNNANELFSPESSTSPYADSLIGTRIKLQLTANSTTVDLWQGWIQTVAIEVSNDGQRQSILKCDQGWPALTDIIINQPIADVISADGLLNNIFERAIYAPSYINFWQLDNPDHSTLNQNTIIGDSADQITLETGRSSFPYYGERWTANTSLANAIRPMIAAENGALWQDRDGKFYFANRHHYLLNQSVQQTISVDNESIRAHYDYGQDIANEISVTVYPREISPTTGVIWQSGSDIEVQGGSVRTVAATITDSNGEALGVYSLEPLDIGNDVIAEDEQGNLVSELITVNTSISGNQASLTITNPLSSSVSVSIELRGRVITRLAPLTVTQQDLESIITYRRQAQHYNLIALNDAESADNFALWELLSQAEAQGNLRYLDIQLSPATASLIQNRTIDDRVAMSLDTADHTQDYFIIGEQGAWSPQDGLAMRYFLRGSQQDSYWILDTSTLDESTRLVY